MYQGTEADVTGIDWSQSGIEEAEKNYPKGRFLVGDLLNTPFKDKEFDSCVLAGVLDYFEDWSEVLKEARRITKGNIIATLLNGFEGHDWSKKEAIKRVGNWIIIKI